VIGVEAPGFEALSERERRFAYLMYRAAIPGNAIAYRQAHRGCRRHRAYAGSDFARADDLEPRCAPPSTTT
jgi:hypothetical protein